MTARGDLYRICLNVGMSRLEAIDLMDKAVDETIAVRNGGEVVVELPEPVEQQLGIEFHGEES